MLLSTMSLIFLSIQLPITNDNYGVSKDNKTSPCGPGPRDLP